MEINFHNKRREDKKVKSYKILKQTTWTRKLIIQVIYQLEAFSSFFLLSWSETGFFHVYQKIKNEKIS